MEKNNEGLRVMFNEVLHGNTKLQKDKKEQEVKYTELQSKLHEKDQEMQCKLQLMERKTEGLQVMFDEVLQRNAQLQKNQQTTGSDAERNETCSPRLPEEKYRITSTLQ